MERLSDVERVELWDRYEAGESFRSISRKLGRAPSTIRGHVVDAGWRRPSPRGEWCPLRLSSSEREEISRGIVGGESFRSIASRLGRSPSTVSREVANNGGLHRYRAVGAHRASRRRAKRPAFRDVSREWSINQSTVPLIRPMPGRVHHVESAFVSGLPCPTRSAPIPIGCLIALRPPSEERSKPALPNALRLLASCVGSPSVAGLLRQWRPICPQCQKRRCRGRDGR
jgi:DNA-binding CsgD family transcriptional regulator